MIDLVMIGWALMALVTRSHLVVLVALEYGLFGLIQEGLSDVMYYVAGAVCTGVVAQLAYEFKERRFARSVVVASAGGVLINLAGLLLYWLHTGPALYNTVYLIWYVVTLGWVARVLVRTNIDSVDRGPPRGARGPAHRSHLQKSVTTW